MTANELIAQNRQQYEAGNHKAAKRLELGMCGLTNLETQVPELFTLTHLEELVLSSWWDEWNNITQKWERKESANKGKLNQIRWLPQAFAQLRQLRVLIANDNKITDISPLATLSALTTLHLRGNKITDISPLTKLSALTELNLDRNNIADISPLATLSALATLHLRHNQITDISPLATLSALATLHLRHNQITDISPLATLSALTTLDLSHNKITDILSLATLSALTRLDLRHNRITDISSLATLSALTKLNLNRNQITDISPLATLRALTTLYLNDNQITDISPLATLSALTILDLIYNRIRDISPLVALSVLAELYLSNNQITDILSLATLSALTTLYLYSNNIADISPLFPLLQRKINPLRLTTNRFLPGSIVIGNNPLTTPPIEIVEQGAEAVLRYFERLATEPTTFLREAKLLIVGEARVGKTSLVTKLQNATAELPKEEHSTRGIDIVDYTFTQNGLDYVAHIWDFGGQQIYRATHQLFLSNRSLYVLVDNSSRDDTKLAYWLQKIDRLAGSDAPTLLVQNELNNRQKTIDEKGLRGEFLHLKETIKFNFDCLDKKAKDELAQLKSTIAEQIAKMPIVGIKVPQSWKNVRDALSAISHQKAFISRTDLWRLCNEKGIEKPADLNDLSQLFHDLGVFLHFKDDAVLKHLVILQKEWATDAIYAVLDDRRIADDKKGRFCKNDLERIWAAVDAANKTKPNNKHTLYLPYTDELLALMLKFELCYQRNDASNEYVIPQLLPKEKPNYIWEGDSGVQLRYNYGNFMPEGILHRLIVRMHRFVTNLNEAWERGCILYEEADGKTKAEVLEPYNENAITIKAVGSGAKNLLTTIAYELDNINKSYGKGLAPDKMVPCNCPECKQLIAQSEKPNFYEYSDLLRRKEKGKPTIECKISYQNVPVLRLIDDVFVTNFFAPQPLNIFISYSKTDVVYKQTLETHLAPLKRQGLISTWSDQELIPGEEWDREVQKNLTTADIILLLVSANFIATDYIWDKEMTRAMERHESREVYVVPIILSPCDWQSAPFAKLNALPAKGTPISKHPNPDEAWTDVATKLRELVNQICKLKS